MTERIVLAYAGGLDTSVAIERLTSTRGAEVVAVTLDVGQGPGLEDIRDRALAAGAARAHVLDVRDEFARDFVLPALKAQALDQDRSPMSAALVRPLIAKKLVEIAGIEQAGALAHGCVRSGRPLPLEAAVRALNPSLTVLAPLREISRAEAVDWARLHGIPPARTDCPHIAVNLWGRTVTWNAGEDPSAEGVYALTKLPEECPDEPASVEITFDRGVPTAINAVTMPFVELIASLGTIAGAHGVGRLDLQKDGAAGPDWRLACEAPAGVVLHSAHKELLRTVVTRDVERFARLLSFEYSDLIDNGLWFSPLRDALDAAVDRIQQRVNGTIRLKLFKGGCVVDGRESSAARERQPASNTAARGLVLPLAFSARKA